MRMKFLVLLVWTCALMGGEAPFGFEAHGFFDVRAGFRLQNDATQRDTSLAESRLQLDLNRMGEWTTLQIRGDAVYDDVIDDRDIDLETGRGWFDLREANLLFSPNRSMDVKVGRQILTWGTGDLLFVNDLFPKDWQSFFSGRQTEYLKAPSDALMMSFFPSFANIDLVYTPRFDADRFIRGERFSYWNGNLGRRAGRDAVVAVDRPDRWVDDGEWALRISRTIKGYELAFYGYDGFWKSPAGQDPVRGLATFPELRVWGASLRGGFGKGLIHAEFGWYDSRRDRDGEDPTVGNGEIRVLLGYERELAREFTLGVQYYLERMLDYENYRASLPAGLVGRDRNRHVTTVRLTRTAMNQNLTLSLFGYASPSDNDFYLRPSVSWKVTDAWQVFAGGNLFGGSRDHTFFGQFEKNSNAYGGFRYSF
ncbi:hypothetical protein SCOR_17625 [Sulfidibacter corallicola]|uniref:Uncharacterized protein n=1 Tax=Sulfidibacter corallicola TaxID=2818388 RepID=A0A8A4U4P9_SULCO|nr:hypothetical protein [Sulfidibacter corallicola]QTD53725.1 hypothetical protein J3U87_14830 [Sulfidibacter corallicola]